MTEVGFPAGRMWMLGACTVTGGIGLLTGLFWWPIGAAAAVGSLTYFVGALAFHLRSRNVNQSKVGATASTVLSIAVLDLRIASS